MSQCISRSARACSLALGIAFGLGPRALDAQHWPGPPTAAVAQQVDTAPPDWLHPLASAAVPGLGQLLAKRDRGAVYLVIETVLIARFIREQTDGNREGERYRDLAFKIARRSFAPTQRDTAFGYFEDMAKFIESGPFDTDPGPALAPPWDPRTFNGRIWQLARETFFANPDSVPSPESLEYQRAVDFYLRRAVGPEFLWSWRGAALEHDLFRQSIQASDDAFRTATQHLGLLLLNHLVSAIDAFVSQRLSRNGRPVRVQAGLAGPGTHPHVAVSVAF